MKNTIEVWYLPSQAQYRADFFKNGANFETKALTADEADALSEVETLPSEGELVTLDADYALKTLEEIGSIDFESNLFTILQELAR